MGPKSLLAPLVLATLILLGAPTADSCVNFSAYWPAGSSDTQLYVSASLWDTAAQSCVNEQCLNTPLCSVDGPPGDGSTDDTSIFQLSCVASDFSVTFSVDSSTGNYASGVVHYTTPWNTFDFAAPDGSWNSCQYGCDRRSVSFCLINKEGDEAEERREDIAVIEEEMTRYKDGSRWH